MASLPQHDSSAEALGFSGRVARAFQANAITPLLALVALFTATPWRVSTLATTACSKAGTAGPCVRKGLRSTSTTVAISASLMVWRP